MFMRSVEHVSSEAGSARGDQPEEEKTKRITTHVGWQPTRMIQRLAERRGIDEGKEQHRAGARDQE